MSHLVQPYMNKENAANLPAANSNSKGRLGSLAGRQGAKTFSVGASPVVTTRQALGNLSNDVSRLGMVAPNRKNPFKVSSRAVFRKPLGSQPMTPGLSMRNPNVSGPSIRNSSPKSKVKHHFMTSTTNPLRQEENYPEIETMHIYQDKVDSDPLPEEDCISSFLDGRGVRSFRVPPKPHATTTQGGDTQCLTNISQLQFDVQEFDASDISTSAVDVDMSLLGLSSCLDLPPLESETFLDINNLLLWDEQTN